MITHKGRVVYDRVQHKFTAKAVGRIIWSEVKFLNSFETGLYVSQILFRLIQKWARDPRGLARVFGFLVGEFEGITGTVEIVPDLPPNALKRSRGSPSDDADETTDMEGGPKDGQENGSLQQ